MRAGKRDFYWPPSRNEDHVTDQPLVIYHDSCQDGFCAAWLFHLAFPKAEFFAAQHGKPPPDVAGRMVFILDFSYKRDILQRMAGIAKSITVLDHHQTAAEDLTGLPEAIWPPLPGLSATFDMKKSGAMLAWLYIKKFALAPNFRPCLSPDGGEPWLVELVQSRDLWKWDVPNAKVLDACLSSLPMTFDEWDYLGTRPFGGSGYDVMVVEGKAILRSQEKIINDLVKKAWVTRIAGHLVPCLNTGLFISEVAGRLSEGEPFAATYFDRADGERIYSLRSREGGLDVSKIAQIFGGGGHKHAAGFQVHQSARLDGEVKL